jgi:hypothetical protein
VVSHIDDRQRQFAVQPFQIRQDFQLALEVERCQPEFDKNTAK